MKRDEIKERLDLFSPDEELMVLPTAVFEFFTRYARRIHPGASTEAIIFNLTGCTATPLTQSLHPKDDEDFVRCWRFLKEFPEYRDRLDEMADVSLEWAHLVWYWDELERYAFARDYRRLRMRIGEILANVPEVPR